MGVPRIMVVGRRQDASALAELMELAGYETALANAHSARRLVLTFRPEIVVADVVCPTIDGLALLRSIGALQPAPRVVMVTSRPSRAIDALGVTCLAKPLELSTFWETLTKLTNRPIRATG